MPRLFGSNVRPDLPDKYGTDGSAEYGAKANGPSATRRRQHVRSSQEEKQRRDLLLRRQLQQPSNVDDGPALEDGTDATRPSSDPRADPDYYDYYQDVDERRKLLLNQLRKRQGGVATAGTRVANQRPVGGAARVTSDYDDYGLDGGMAGVGTSAVGASAIDRHGYGPQKRAFFSFGALNVRMANQVSEEAT